MPRALDAALATAMTGKVFPAIILVDLTTNAETLHVWSGIGTFSWNGNSYIGVGNLGQISPAQEGVEVQASGSVLNLSGVNPADVADALSNIQLGAPATIWLGAVNEATLQLLGQPVILFRGLVDAPTVRVGAEQASDGSPATATISIPIESRLATLGSGQQRRYSRADQNLTHPDDTAFAYTSLLSMMALRWGQ
jgi:hypothetical protein